MAHTSLGTPSPALFGSLSGTYSTLAQADAFYKVNFTALNNSGVQGGAFLAFDIETNQLTVITGATGVEPGAPHPQHIHGFPSATPDAQSPTLAQDDDLDGFVELAEGLDTYGPILLQLQSPPESGLSGFPMPSDDNFVFIQTYDLDDITFDADPNDGVPGVPASQVLTLDNLDEREIVLHGLTLKAGQGANGGEADGTAGYKAVLPIAAGDIQRLEGDEVAYQFSEGRFQIGNKVAALDVQGSSGQAFRLYDLFNREGDIQGLSFWTEKLDDTKDLSAVAQSFLNSDEFKFNFGSVSSLSNGGYVDVLYQNVLERSGEASGVTYWLDQLDQGASRASVLAAFSESAENIAQNEPLLQNGILLNEGVLI